MDFLLPMPFHSAKLLKVQEPHQELGPVSRHIPEEMTTMSPDSGPPDAYPETNTNENISVSNISTYMAPEIWLFSKQYEEFIDNNNYGDLKYSTLPDYLTPLDPYPATILQYTYHGDQMSEISGRDTTNPYETPYSYDGNQKPDTPRKSSANPHEPLIFDQFLQFDDLVPERDNIDPVLLSAPNPLHLHEPQEQYCNPVPNTSGRDSNNLETVRCHLTEDYDQVSQFSSLFPDFPGSDKTNSALLSRSKTAPKAHTATPVPDKFCVVCEKQNTGKFYVTEDG
jgi:hypothetical protein